MPSRKESKTNMKWTEIIETGCNGKVEKRTCACTLKYVKLAAVKINHNIYKRNHWSVVPTYASDGRYQCDGCGNFFIEQPGKYPSIVPQGMSLPNKQKVKDGFTYHCKHGWDYCHRCMALAPPAPNKP